MSDIVDRLYRGATWMTDADCMKAASEICRLRAKVADLSVGAPDAVDEWSNRAHNMLSAMEALVEELNQGRCCNGDAEELHEGVSGDQPGRGCRADDRRSCAGRDPAAREGAD